MSIHNEKYDLIDKYLRGDLSSEEMFAFENEIGNNSELAEQLQLHRVADELSFEKGLVDIWEKVGQDLSQPPPSSNPYKTILGLFLGALILAGISVYFLAGKKKENVVLSRSGSLKQVDQKESDKVERSTEKTLPRNEENKENTINQGSKENKLHVTPDTTPILKENVVTSKEEEPLKQQLPINADSPVIPDKTCPEITFGVQIQASCGNQENGGIQIMVSDIKGGEKPYSYSIAGSDFNLQSFNNHLAKGIYSVKIKDNQGCVGKKQVEVTEKSCTENKDYTFNPQLGNWKLPFLPGESGTITISNQAGKIVLKNKIINGAPEEWDGKSLTGEAVEMGSYFYIAETEEGEIRQGYITIVH